MNMQRCLWGAHFPAVSATPSRPTSLIDKMSSYPLGAFEIKGNIQYCVYKEIKAVGQGTVSLCILPTWRKTQRLVYLATQVTGRFPSLLRSHRQTNEFKYPHQDRAMRKFPDPKGMKGGYAVQISLCILII